MTINILVHGSCYESLLYSPRKQYQERTPPQVQA